MALFWILALSVLLNRDHEVVFFNDFRLLASDQLLVIWAQRHFACQQSLIILSEDLGGLHPLRSWAGHSTSLRDAYVTRQVVANAFVIFDRVHVLSYSVSGCL